MFHIRGKLKDYWSDNKEELFNSKSKICIISKQQDESYLLYSKDKKINLKKYFKNYKIITKKSWTPAFVYPKLIIETKLNNNLYIIGDHNFAGLEDAYITGLYAANQIINCSKAN